MVLDPFSELIWLCMRVYFHILLHSFGFIFSKSLILFWLLELYIYSKFWSNMIYTLLSIVLVVWGSLKLRGKLYMNMCSCMWKSQDNFWEWFFCLCSVVIRLALQTFTQRTVFLVPSTFLFNFILVFWGSLRFYMNSRIIFLFVAISGFLTDCVKSAIWGRTEFSQL